MADLIELDLVVREKGLKQSLTTVERLERQLTKAAKAIDSNRISQERYNKILLQSKRDYQALGLSSQKATALVRKFAEAQRGAVQTTNNLTGAVKQQTQAQMAATKSSNRMGVVTQQAGYQVSDFVVQVQSGTNAFVAFGQQASQLVGVLPLMAGSLGLTAGAAIGLSAGLGIIIPLLTAVGAALSRTRDAAKGAEEEVRTLSDSIQSLNTIQRTTAQDFEEGLNKAFDSSAEAVGRLLSLLREAEFAAAMEPIKDSLDGLTVGVDRLDIALDTLVGFQKIVDEGKQLSVVQQGLRSDAEKLVQENLALAIASKDVKDALDAIGESKTTKELVTNFAEALALAESLGGPVGVELTESLRSAAEEAGLLEQILSLSEEAAGGIAEKVSLAVISLKNLEDARQTGGGRGSGTEFFGQDDYTSELGYKSVDEVIEELTKTTKKLGKTTKDSLSAAEEAIEEARQAAEEYADALDNTVVSAVGSVSDAWADFVMRGFKDFKGFVGSVLDSFKNMISQMIAMAARNRIMLSLGIGGVAPTAAMAGSGMLGGAGILGGGGAGIGAAMSGVGSGIAGIMSGGGLGASFANLGGLLSGSVGGLGAIGAAIPAVAAVAVVVGLFSKKVKELDSGLRVTVDNTDTLVESYRKLETSRLFGLMKKQSTQFEEADEETAAPITKAVADVQASVVDMASALGIGSDAFSDFSYQFQVSLKGLSEEEALVAIQQEFSNISDAMADLVPNLMDFALEGETSSQVLKRLSSDLLTVNNVFRTLGRSAESMSIQAADAASRLVSAAGGQSAFVSKTQTLVGSYLDPTEQLSYYQRQLEGVFEGGLPSKSQVKGILQEGSIEELETLYGGDTIQTLGTIFQLQDQIAAEEKARKEEAKRKAQAAAAAAARAAKERADAAKRAEEAAAKAQQKILDERLGLEEELLKLQGNTAELRRRELEALDPTNRALQEMIWKLQDAKEVMDGISESDFATLFDYQRAVAMSRVNTVANNPQPVSPMPAVVNGSPTVSPDSMPSGSSEGSTLENNTFVRQSLVEIIKYSKRTSDTLRKFDNDGLPPERT